MRDSQRQSVALLRLVPLYPHTSRVRLYRVLKGKVVYGTCACFGSYSSFQSIQIFFQYPVSDARRGRRAAPNVPLSTALHTASLAIHDIVWSGTARSPSQWGAVASITVRDSSDSYYYTRGRAVLCVPLGSHLIPAHVVRNAPTQFSPLDLSPLLVLSLCSSYSSSRGNPARAGRSRSSHTRRRRTRARDPCAHKCSRWHKAIDGRRRLCCRRKLV